MDSNAAASTIDVHALKSLVPLFSLSDERLAELATLSSLVHVKSGVQLFQEGDVDNQSVYLLEGKVRLQSSDEDYPENINANLSAARHPLDDHQPRRVTAVAVTDVTIIRIDNSVLDYMITWEQLGALAPAAVATAPDQGPEQVEEEWMRGIQQALPFRNIPGSNLRTLLERMERVEVSAGDVVVSQGEMGDYYYLIEQGCAHVTRQVKLAELESGCSFGEEALLASAARNATVTMTTDGNLLRLSKKDFDELLREPLLDWVSPSEARERVNRGAIWLDVRHAREFNHHRLSNAVNIPLHELRQRLDELDSEQSYVCYCKTGRRSSAAAFLLNQSGLKASVLRGGLQVLPAVFRM